MKLKPAHEILPQRHTNCSHVSLTDMRQQDERLGALDHGHNNENGQIPSWRLII